jgi:RHS repeat-associated protein
MLTLTDPLGITYLTNAYDANSRVCQQTQADGGTYLFYYITADRATLPESQTLLAQAAAGGPITQAPCTGTASSALVVSTVVVDPRGKPTTYQFNGQSFLTGVTNALGQTTAYTRDAATNQVLSVTDPLGRVTAFAYDANGNVTSVTDPASSVRTFTYESTFNKVTSATDPLGHVTSFAYDPANGNLLSITDPLGHATQIAYNGVGQPVSTTDALGNVTQFGYNAQGDLATITDPLGNNSTRTYDPVSRLIQQTDPRGKATTFTYDILNRLVKLVDPIGATTAFTYDANGNLLTVTDPRGGTIAYAYDSMDRVTTRTDPLGQPETYTYDLAGNATSALDRKGQTSTLTYDALNRRSVTTYADGSTVTATYDAAGRLTSLADSVAGTISWTYDLLDRVTSETTPQGTVSYAYDAAGRRTTMTVAGQSPVTYAYDNSNRLLTIAKDTLTATYAYDNANRRTALSLPNGVTTQYAYDQASRLTGLTYVGPSGTLGTLTYAYDAAGNRVGVDGSWARTLLPNPIATASYDAANRQLTFGGKTLTFDANGNLLTMNEGGNTTTYTWDARDRLMSLSGAGMSGVFAYDSVGRRAQKTVNGETTSFQYDDLDIVREVVGSAEVRYLRSLAIDEPLARIETAGTAHYLGDALGSIVALTDGTGSLSTNYAYGPFGQVSSAGTTSANTFQYTGRENDGTGLYYYRARYYAAGLYRFIGEDPIRGAGRNQYSYVFNTPLNAIDPDGLDWIIMHGHLPSYGPNGSSDSGGNRGLNEIERQLKDAGERSQRFNMGQWWEAAEAAQAARAAGRPVCIVGHSAGGAGAIEATMELYRRGIYPDNLVIIDGVGLPRTVLPPEVRTTNLVQRAPRAGDWTSFYGERLRGAQVREELIAGIDSTEENPHRAITRHPRVVQAVSQCGLGGRK